MFPARRAALSILSAARRCSSTSSAPSRREFKVVLDNETLYVEQPLAEALGWTPDVPSEKGVSLTLSGWAPHYFAIAPTGSDSGEHRGEPIKPLILNLSSQHVDRLARGTVESSRNPRVQELLEYLKDR